MTEAEWLDATDPDPMLIHLRGKVSVRKLRLFAGACCRRIWNQLADERSCKAVEAAEQYADRTIAHPELKRAWAEAAEAFRGPVVTHSGQSTAAAAAMHVANARGTSFVDAVSAASRAGVYTLIAFNREKEAQADLLRELFGNSFRPVMLISSWRTSTVTALATSAYQERSLPSGHLDPDRLAVLADALEDAGCDNRDILDHLRSPGPHLRGCFALDLILGNQ